MRTMAVDEMAKAATRTRANRLEAARWTSTNSTIATTAVRSASAALCCRISLAASTGSNAFRSVSACLQASKAASTLSP
jgi:hypothetical protein